MTAPEPPPNTESLAGLERYRLGPGQHVELYVFDRSALDDLSVLAQIPKVRELVKALRACESPQHDWLLDQWEVWL